MSYILERSKHLLSMKLNLIIALTLLFMFTYEPKKYEYSAAGFFYESIELRENNRFHYYATMHMMGKTDIDGSYYIVNDTLFLNSNPQRDRMIVEEDRSDKKNDRYFYFNVKSKTGGLITYHLYITLESGRELVYRDQFQSTKISVDRIRSFYIIGVDGIKSPTYIVQGVYTNIYNIQFEVRRVFEDESWVIKNDSIKPKGPDGEFRNYFLIRK